MNYAIHNITNAINTLNAINSMSDFKPENTSLKIRLIFLSDQLKYLIVSPACYCFIQASNCVILPHERKLLNIKNNIVLESEYTKILAEVASTFND